MEKNICYKHKKKIAIQEHCGKTDLSLPESCLAMKVI